MSQDRTRKPPQPDVGDLGEPQRRSTPQASTSALLHRAAGQPVYDPMFYVRHERAQAASDAARTVRNLPYRKAKGAPTGASHVPQGSGASLPANTRAVMEQHLE